MKASRKLPNRLPIQVQTQLESSSETLALRVSTAMVNTRLLPVNNSEPAKITMVSAPPKHTPMSSRTGPPGTPLPTVPPTVKMRAMAAPTYMPASIDRTRWLMSERRCASSFAAACSPITLTVSEYMQVSSLILTASSWQVSDERFQGVGQPVNG